MNRIYNRNIADAVPFVMSESNLVPSLEEGTPPFIFRRSYIRGLLKRFIRHGRDKNTLIGINYENFTEMFAGI